MVKVGDFKVELVAADTKTPFKEHTAPDGQVYAEVEPDMDYFISLSTNIGGVIMRMSVDGVDLKYHSSFELSKMNYFTGAWERRNGKSITKALHFNKTRQEVGATSNMLTGKVEVSIYRMGEKYYQEARDFVSASLTADSTLGGKKCIKSTTSGSHSMDVTPKGQTATSKIVNYRYGERLCTITLNYCSALGLIYNKILPPPPDSDSEDDSVQVKREKMRRKRKRSTDTSVSAARSSQRNATIKSENGQKQQATVPLTQDIVDLSVRRSARVSPEGNAGQVTVTVQRTYDLIDLSADD